MELDWSKVDLRGHHIVLESLQLKGTLNYVYTSCALQFVKSGPLLYSIYTLSFYLP